MPEVDTAARSETAAHLEISEPRPGADWSFAGVSFHAECAQRGVVSDAQSLFQQWRTGLPIVVRKAWQIEPVGNQWSVIDAGTGTEISRARSEPVALAHLETHSITALIEGPGTPPSLHACIVVRPDGAAIACIGRCGSGKSTLALTLWHHAGWHLACDDVALIDSEPGFVLPVPRRVSARSSSRALLGEACWERIQGSPHCIPTVEGFLFHPAAAPVVPVAARLSAIFLLERLEGTAAPGRTKPVAPADAVLALAPYGSARLRDGLGGGIRAVAPLADAVPVYELGRGEPLEMIRSINAVLP